VVQFGNGARVRRFGGGGDTVRLGLGTKWRRARATSLPRRRSDDAMWGKVSIQPSYKRGALGVQGHGRQGSAPRRNAA
jgi:hypothetical protein